MATSDVIAQEQQAACSPSATTLVAFLGVLPPSWLAVPGWLLRRQPTAGGFRGGPRYRLGTSAVCLLALRPSGPAGSS